MNKIFLLLIFLFVNSNTALCLDSINEKLLQYAQEAKLKFEDVRQLHDYLIKPTNTQREKAEIFFYWISQHIEYDLNKYNQISNGEKLIRYNSIKEKKGVCGDYTNLFKALCDLSNIECYHISGYAKTSAYKKGSHFKIVHAWNVIKLEGNFEFVDCTWGSGKMIQQKDGNLKYKKEINTSQVFVNSEIFRAFHLSESPKWQLLEHPVSYERYIENSDFKEMYNEETKPFMFRDSIKNFNSVSKEFQPVQERIDAYNFNSSYRNAFECGRNYEIAAQKLSSGEFNLENIKRAKSYYETSKTWYVKSFKLLNNNSDNPDRTQIEFIKKVNKKIKFCDSRIKAKR